MLSPLAAITEVLPLGMVGVLRDAMSLMLWNALGPSLPLFGGILLQRNRTLDAVSPCLVRAASPREICSDPHLQPSQACPMQC